MKIKNILAILIITGCSANLTAQNLGLDSNLGYKNAQTVAAEMILYQDVEKTAYIQKVGDRLISNLEKPLFKYQFHIIADPIPNAFALPGGYIYVTTGLILLLDNEDELACILGHEIIHSNNRHAIKQLKKSIIPKSLEIPGELLGIITPTLGAIVNAPLKGLNSLLFASYSKHSENEADKLGTDLAAKSGYDPIALNTILDRLSVSLEMLSGEKEKKSYLSNHPYTPKRVERISKNATELKWTKKESYTTNIAKEFEGILIGSSPKSGIINKNIFSHPSLNFRIDFPKDWKLENTNEAVGAYTKDEKGMLAITIANKQVSPKDAAKTYMSGLHPKKKSLIIKSDTVTFNGLQAYLVILENTKGKDVANAYIAWVKLDSTLISITGLTTSKYNTTTYNAIKSIAPLSKKDQENLTFKTLKVVSAKENENIKELSKRSSNTLSIKETTLINAIKGDEQLTKDMSIKIAVETPYLYKVKE